MATSNNSGGSTADLDPETARRVAAERLAHGLSLLPPLSPSLIEKYVTVQLAPTDSAKIKVIHPSSHPSTPRPLIVLFFGGGFKAGSIDQLTEPGRTFAEHFNAVVVLGSYRLVPGVRWPEPWEDGWRLLSYLSHHAHESMYGGAELSLENGGGFVVGGISAGASIAAVCGGLDALRLAERENIEPLASKLTGIMANVPFLLVPEIVPEESRHKWTAWQDNRMVDGFNTTSLETVIRGIECTDYTSCWFSPIPELLRSQKVLADHPRVYVSVCQFDPLRDDGRIYRHVLERRGVEVKMDLFPDDGHNGWTVLPVPRKSQSPTIPEAYMGGMKWLLRK